MDELTLNKSGLGVLKKIAHKLGVPGSKSHTKYTKKNKDELIQQILKFQKMKDSQNTTPPLTLETGEPSRKKENNDDELDSNSDSSDNNKELAKMTKRKLQKSLKDESNNQIYVLLAVAGAIIVGASLYNQQKSIVENKKPKTLEIEDRHRQEQVVEQSHSEQSAKPSSLQVAQGPGIYSF